MLSRKKERVIELADIKVLSNGSLTCKATIKAAAFSKGTQAKMKGGGRRGNNSEDAPFVHSPKERPEAK